MQQSLAGPKPNDHRHCRFLSCENGKLMGATGRMIVRWRRDRKAFFKDLAGRKSTRRYPVAMLAYSALLRVVEG